MPTVVHINFPTEAQRQYESSKEVFAEEIAWAMCKHLGYCFSAPPPGYQMEKLVDALVELIP